MTTNQNESGYNLLKRWQYSIRVCHKAHIRTAAYMNKRNRILGIPVLIISTIVGTAVFSTLDSNPQVWVKVIVGSLSVIAAVLAGLQTFLSYSEKEEMHKLASQKYGALRREIEEFLVLPKESNKNLEEFISSVRTRWDSIDNDSPSLSQKLYDQIAAGIKASSLKREKA